MQTAQAVRCAVQGHLECRLSAECELQSCRRLTWQSYRQLLSLAGRVGGGNEGVAAAVGGQALSGGAMSSVGAAEPAAGAALLEAVDVVDGADCYVGAALAACAK